MTLLPTEGRGYKTGMADRDTVLHLAADTGLAPEEIDPDVSNADERAAHLSKDTGVKEAELKTSEPDVVGQGLAKSPLD